MQEDLRLPKELQDMEAALRGLAPAGHSLDRDGVMFSAGEAAGRRAGARRLRLWKGVSGLMLVAVAVWVGFGPVRTVERRVVVQVPTENARANGELVGRSESDATPAPMAMETMTRATEGEGYLALRQQVLMAGMSALPDSSGVGSNGSGAARRDVFDGLPMWRQRAELLKSSGVGGGGRS